VDTVQRLDQMKLFEGLSREDLARWASKFRREPYAQDAVILRENERAKTFYIVDSGELYAHVRDRDGELPRAYFYPGDYFGETGLLTGEPRNATIRASTSVELLALDKLDFDQLLEEFPDIRERLIATGHQREEAGRIRFPWLRPDEVTVFFSTKHWVALLHALRLTLLMGVAGSIIAVLFLSSAWARFPSLVSNISMLVSGISLGLTAFFGLYHYLDWRNDHYIVTNLRVLHVERVLLLREDRDEAPLEHVQDVQVKQDGLWANVLNYGNVVIQTAAATEQIVFTRVAQPDYVREALFSPLQRAGTQSKAEMRESIRQELGRRLGLKSAQEEQEETETQESPTPPAEKNAKDGMSAALARVLDQVWRWFRRQVTFDTWIFSDGDKTVTWRKNGWLLVSVSIPPFLVALSILVLIFWSLTRGIGLPEVPIVLFMLLLPTLGWWSYLYWDWQNDIYQISGHRLIDLKKRPLFMEEIRRETTLDRVQNISLSIPGPIAQLLNYGTVVIETAGETGAFEFDYVHDPRRVQTEIFNRLEQFKRDQVERDRQRRLDEMAEWFEIYDGMKQGQRQENTEEAEDEFETNSISG